MPSNLDRYKKDLDALIAKGERVTIVMQHDCFPKETEDQIKSQLKDGAQKFISALEPFSDIYQAWVWEAKMWIGQLLPDRSYRLEDYLQGLTVSHLGDEIVQKSAAIPHLQQQLAILKAVKARFESSLFDIRQLVQSDLFDSELDAAKELA